jgi:predicted dehydrogenase
MSNLKIGVIGVGHIGREHARICAKLPNATFAGVFDLDSAVAHRIAQQHNVKAFPTLEAMADEVDAVSIATPTNSHHRIGTFFLGRGKHALIEKPISDNTAQARELVELALRNAAVLQVGHIERFNPALRALEEKLTRPKFIEAHRLSPYPGRSTDVGVVLDLMIHDLEIVLHLVRSPLVSLDAVGVAVLSQGEDIANARLRFENGCVANLTTSRISPEKLRKIRVFQDDTYLSLDYQNQSGEMYRKVKNQITRESILVHKDEPLKLEIASFVESAINRRDPVVSGAKATDALEVAMRITEMIAKANSQ